jgi:Zinc finger, C2H2 type
MPPKCPVCASDFDEGLLEAHLRGDHPSYRPGAPTVRVPHRCVFCGATFDQPEQLRDHHLSAHGK